MIIAGCLNFKIKFWTVHISNIILVAWAEDRALRGRNPSADSGPVRQAAPARFTAGRPPLSSMPAGWPQSEKSQGVWGTGPPDLPTPNGEEPTKPLVP